MAYQAKVVYTRPSTDVEWFVFRTDLPTDQAAGDRMVKLLAFLDTKSSIITQKVEFSADNLQMSYIHEFEDEATYNTFKAEYDTFVAEQLDGIEPREENIFTTWLAETGCVVSNEFVTI